MLLKVKSCGLIGIDGYVIGVETDIGGGLPGFEIVGLADIAVRESKERVRAALKNTGIEFPIGKITINLAPANVRKEGSSFDLPIALGILGASGQIHLSDIDSYVFAGELSLDGQLRHVNGALPMAISAYQAGIKNFILPAENADEAAVVKGLNVFPANNLREVILHLMGRETLPLKNFDFENAFRNSVNNDMDFADVKGQANAKRALEVAASGAHNCMQLCS